VKDHEILLYMYFRADLSEPVELRHNEVMHNMQRIDPPLGWKGIELPPVPDFGSESYAGYSIEYPMPGIDCTGGYDYRGDGKHLRDWSSSDEILSIGFNASDPAISYTVTLRDQFPKLIEAYRSYRAVAYFDLYGDEYTGGLKNSNPTYNRLRADKSINVNGRNNIFTLEPAMYWDALLCQRALGYDRDEVIRRLQGKVPLVMPLMDGVYTIFNDDPELSYEEFVAFNDQLKPVLGLI
jgi:hypothetical protein